ncbi:hypothetical protein HYH02_008550 [Chlamydomonas schloesseri]|uniref:NADPH-dependent diflavin oxidoreductase 1 n=1 Tax=Chlamydomonas schloesseri TaxID=2026947 RepID=A0A835WFM7_9CHLO|nr:hypothetical protein HYH02_008550 [Chlamydomonas schloesseri]|eukprot:KAG2446563.1 hypothetical protein HYH02_008550 [Chlamydomonas schloesseri]
MGNPLLILYGSQTGNAQDVAERIGREARLRLYSPRVVAMDSYVVTNLPSEPLVVFVTATAGQGEPPDNMRRTWRFLLRKSLPPDSLAGLRFGVFGLGDSGYPQYNVMAKKLDRRLAGLGATCLLERGLGDDQHPSGYEAALDPWLARLWPALRAVSPLPAGVPEPVVTEAALLELGPPKYTVTLLPRGGAAEAAARRALAARLAAEQPQVRGLAAVVLARGCSTADSGNGSAANGSSSPAAAAAAAPQQQEPVVQGDGIADGGGGGGLAAHCRLAEAAAAATDFRRLLQAAAGAAPPEAGGGEGGGAEAAAAGTASYGPWRPYLARLVANRRITAPDHFQDTRHVELDLERSGLSYEPGDIVSILPMPSEAVVDAFLARLGLDGERWAHVELASEAAGPEGQQGLGGVADAAPGGRSPGVHGFTARVRSIVAGCLDIGGGSPRRYLFQVLMQCAAAEHERERLAYFATADGRDDLYRYNQREGRTLLEVLQDFRSARPCLARLLEAAPHLRPRQFSAASSPRLRGPAAVQLLVALVSYTTPYKRPRRGLCSAYLAGLDPEGEGKEEGEEEGTTEEVSLVRVAVWTEAGALRMPRSLRTPLILVGPGTGVAPFRSFLEERYALAQQAAAAAAAAATTAPGEAAPLSPPPLPPAPCFLFFGCRSPTADFYYASQWEEYQRVGVLDRQRGLITAFSRQHVAAQGSGLQEGQPPPPPSPSQAQELAAAAPAGTATAVATKTATSKVYVTQRIREHGELLWRLLNGLPPPPPSSTAADAASPTSTADSAGGAAATRSPAAPGAVAGDAGAMEPAVVYVSGSAQKMPAGVAAAFADVAAAHGGLDKEAAAAWVRQLELKGRYFVEAWS